MLLRFARRQHSALSRTTFVRGSIRAYTKDFDPDHDTGPKQYHAEKSPIVAKLWGQRTAYARQEELQLARTPVDAQNAEHTLLEKTPADSRLRIVYNFSTDDALRHLYIDAAGHVMTGKLFEDLDALAGNIAFRHCDDGNPASPSPNLVTVSVDKIIQSQPLSAANDIVLFGQMAWVGTSSMDILIKAFNAKDVIGLEGMPEILDDDGSKALMTSVFTFVARSGRAGGAVSVNKLAPSSPYEEAVFNKRKLRTEARKKSKTVSHDDKATLACQKTITQLVERGSAMVQSGP
jgi:acyl-coenzyme A thioesterase 9